MTLHEYFQCYRRGWKHGACSNAHDTKFSEHPDAGARNEYIRGYVDGRNAAAKDAREWCTSHGYDPGPSVLRR